MFQMCFDFDSENEPNNKISKPATSVSGFGLLVGGQEGIRWNFRIELVFVFVSEFASEVSLWIA